MTEEEKCLKCGRCCRAKFMVEGEVFDSTNAFTPGTPSFNARETYEDEKNSLRQRYAQEIWHAKYRFNSFFGGVNNTILILFLIQSIYMKQKRLVQLV